MIIGTIISTLIIYFTTSFVNLAALSSYAVVAALLLGFSLGLAITLFVLFFVFLATFPATSLEKQFAYFRYFDEHPKLFFIGLFYGIGVWVVNWVIWFGDGSRQLYQSFIFHPVYDNSVFWAYLTVTPTLIIFVVIVETRFFHVYQTFYQLVNNKGSLNEILAAKNHMQLVLKQELERLFRNQFVFTIIMITFSGFLFERLHMESEFITIFRFTAIGAFANILFLVVTLLLLYFEDQTGALIGTVLFFSMNFLLTAFFLPFGFNAYGISYSIGSIFSLTYATVRLIGYVDKIDYHTFCRQRVPNNSNRFQRIGQYLDKIPSITFQK